MLLFACATVCAHCTLLLACLVYTSWAAAAWYSNAQDPCWCCLALTVSPGMGPPHTLRVPLPVTSQSLVMGCPASMHTAQRSTPCCSASGWCWMAHLWRQSLAPLLVSAERAQMELIVMPHQQNLQLGHSLDACSQRLLDEHIHAH